MLESIEIIFVNALGRAIASPAIEPGPPSNQELNPLKNPINGDYALFRYTVEPPTLGSEAPSSA